MAAKRNKKNSDAGSWVLIVILFAIGLWPIALILLFFKLFGKDEKKKRVAPPPLNTQIPYQPDSGEASENAQPSKARRAARKVTKSPSEKTSTARWLKIAGVVVTAVGLIACWEPLDMMIWLGEIDTWYMEDLLAALAMAVAGIAMLVGGVSMDRSLRRYNKYLAVLGGREAMAMEEPVRTLGYSAGQVEKDLQKMIEQGYFGESAYLNLELGYLFCSRKGAEEVKKERVKQEEAAKTEAPEQEETWYADILRNIRRANDDIDDPVLSTKIDRLEEIARKIFQAVEEDPRKRSRIDTFLNYYLPTTQKLLDSYAQFEDAGVEGENLRQAKSRIEGTMDAIVEGFEHQLDQLYKADALDVDSDIRVMETMLHRDTASVEKDFGLHVQPGEKSE